MNAVESIDLQTLIAASIHETKNLLGQLTLSLDELAASGAPADRARFIGRRISDRMVQMLTLYRMDKGRLQLNIEAHSPRDLIEELVAEMRGLAGGRIEVTSVASELPPFWFFDRDLVQMALLNAAHNALACAREKILIDARVSADCLEIRVSDDGRGYPAIVMNSRDDAPVRQARGGTGLGLFFAELVAHTHVNGDRRGALVLANKADAPGAVFSLLLP
jgi:signal transduction histidine kinase